MPEPDTQPAPRGDTRRHLYLVDGSGYIFRAFFALPPMTRADGTPTNAVFGFTNMLLKLVEDAKADADADYLAVFFDTARKSFRTDLYPDYKANRPEAPEALVPQFPLIREATRALGLPSIEMAGFEADDLIATHARAAAARGVTVTIVSSDKDLMQLVGDGIAMLDPMKNRRIGPEEVREKFGVGPEKVVDVQALAGDSSDNVPGVPGIGVKTAAQLIQDYGDLDSLLERAGEIKQPKRRENLITHANLARLSRELVTLRDDVPVAERLEDFALRDPDPKVLTDFLQEQGFQKILSRVASRFPSAAGAPSSGTAPAPTETNYALVQTRAALETWIAEARELGTVAVDTETTSLNAMRARLVGVSLSTAPGHACYIPLGHRTARRQGQLALGDEPAEAGDEATPAQIPMDEALALLKPLLEDPAVLKIGQNLKYDMLVLSRPEHGAIAITPVDDTMLLSYVTEGGLHGHGMDALAELHLGYQTIKFSEVAGRGRDQITFDLVPLDKALDYAAEDADITLRLHRVLKPQLIADHLVTVYETLERPLIPVLVAMERAGVAVDRDELERLSRDFAARMATLEDEIHRLAGHDFNIGSPKQLGEVLFDEMGLAGGKKGKTGAYATGAGVLESLAQQGHDLPARVLDWRQLAKLKSTYADALVAEIHPQTGRVHTSYAMAATSTGRLASSDPNLQNIPVRTEEGRKIRRAFVAAPGHRLVSLDYSQIELRLLAHVADIAALKDAFRAGLDIHALTASEVFGVPVEGMDPMVRRRAKAINFGIIYGISAFGLANQLGLSRSEAQDYIDAYFARFPGIRAYMDKTKVAAREQGFVTTPFGRRCHMPGINDKNPNRRNFAERAAINAPLQGGAADIIKRAMIRVPEALEGAGLAARMLLQVHDELMFEVPEAEVAETIAVVSAVMENAPRPALVSDIPFPVDAGSGDNWADAH